MGWAIGEHDGRDIGYGVPATCDHPECEAKIDRGLAYVCGGQPYGGDEGCGLFFCDKHRHGSADLCERCIDGRSPFKPKPDAQEWIDHKETDPSWAEWREERKAKS